MGQNAGIPACSSDPGRRVEMKLVVARHAGRDACASQEALVQQRAMKYRGYARSASNSGLICVLFGLALIGYSRPSSSAIQSSTSARLENVRMRDVCILRDDAAKLYYAVSSTTASAKADFGRSAVRVYSSKDLLTWTGPQIVFQTPINLWGDINIRSILGPGNALLQRQVLSLPDF
jgi:hypothetical protein